MFLSPLGAAKPIATLGGLRLFVKDLPRIDIAQLMHLVDEIRKRCLMPLAQFCIDGVEPIMRQDFKCMHNFLETPASNCVLKATDKPVFGISLYWTRGCGALFHHPLHQGGGLSSLLLLSSQYWRRPNKFLQRCNLLGAIRRLR